MKMLMFPDLQNLKGISFCRVHLDRLEKAGTFPKRVHLGPNRVGWVEAEIDRWLAARVAERDASPALAGEAAQ